MFDPDTIVGLAALVSIVFQIVGAWMVHSRLHNWQSKALLACWLSLLIWVPISMIAQDYAANHFETSSSKALLNWIYVFFDVFAPAAFLVLSSASFLLVARTIPLRAP